MKIAASTLIDDLIARTEANAAAVSEFAKRTDGELNRKPAQDSWSVLECIEHLNLYGDFYIPAMAQKIRQATKSRQQAAFRSGWFGNYFAKSMLPQEKSKKVKTFKDKDPSGSLLDRSVLDRFLDQQKELVDLLKQAEEVNLSRVRVPMSISKLIRLRLGDTFRIVIYHNQRHIVQAGKVISSLPESEKSILS